MKVKWIRTNSLFHVQRETGTDRFCESVSQCVLKEVAQRAPNWSTSCGAVHGFGVRCTAFRTHWGTLSQNQSVAVSMNSRDYVSENSIQRDVTLNIRKNRFGFAFALRAGSPRQREWHFVSSAEFTRFHSCRSVPNSGAFSETSCGFLHRCLLEIAPQSRTETFGGAALHRFRRRHCRK